MASITRAELDYRPSYIAAAATATAVMILYLLTLSPSTAMWDASEYIAAAYVMGLPHPPGNPFFVLEVVATEHADLDSDRPRSRRVVAGHHRNADARPLARRDGVGPPRRVGLAVDQQVPAVGADRELRYGAREMDAVVLLAGPGRRGHEDGALGQLHEKRGGGLRDVRQGLALVHLDAEQPRRVGVGHAQAERGGGVDEGAVEVARDERAGGGGARGGRRTRSAHALATALPSAPVAPRVYLGWINPTQV